MEIIQAKNQWHTWVHKKKDNFIETKKLRDYKKTRVIESLKGCSFSPKLNLNRKNQTDKYRIYRNSIRLHKQGMQTAENKKKLIKKSQEGMFQPKINKKKNFLQKLEERSKSHTKLGKTQKKNLNRSKSELIFKESVSHVSRDLEIDVKRPDDSSINFKNTFEKKNEGIDSFFKGYPIQEPEEEKNCGDLRNNEESEFFNFRTKKNLKTINRKTGTVSIYLDNRDKIMIENLLKKVEIYEELVKEKSQEKRQKNKLLKNTLDGNMVFDSFPPKIDMRQVFKYGYKTPEIKRRKTKRRIKQGKTRRKTKKKKKAKTPRPRPWKEEDSRTRKKKKIDSAVRKFTKKRRKKIEKKKKKIKNPKSRISKKSRRNSQRVPTTGVYSAMITMNDKNYNNQRNKDLKDAKNILKSRIMKSLMGRKDFDQMNYSSSRRKKINFDGKNDMSMVDYKRNINDFTFSEINQMAEVGPDEIFYDRGDFDLRNNKEI